MTQREKEIFEKLLVTTFEALEQSVKERDSVREYYIQDKMYEAEMAQRRSDKYYGYAYGIYHALSEMGYKDNGMNELYELLKQ